MSEERQYRIIHVLGKGGFGTVYKAEFLGEGGFRKAVALKILNKDMAGHTEVARRFRDEARVLGLVRHSAIVHVDGLVWLDGRWAVVMEYIEGVDISALLFHVRVPPIAALSIAGEIADALHVAYHKQGVDGRPLHLLHRDIKPSNVQLTSSGEVKILDFGTARADFSGREAETQALSFGTLDYMSPERYDFLDGPAGDVYALGALLYEMLAGEPLGRTSSKSWSHERLLDQALAKLRESLGPDHYDLTQFVGHLLAYEAHDRPTAKETEQRCADLSRALEGERLREWAQRIVPPLIGQREQQHDKLHGSTLVEQAGAPSLDQDSQEHAPWRDPAAKLQKVGLLFSLGSLENRFLGIPIVVWSVLIGFTIFSTLMLGTAATWLRLLPTPTPEVAVEGPEPDPKPAMPSSNEAPPASKTRTVDQGPVRTSPVPRPAAMGQVRITGDADSVTLVRRGQRHHQGAVPAGTYQIQAVFSGFDPMIAGQVRVVSGRTVTIDCSAAFTRCTTR